MLFNIFVDAEFFMKRLNLEPSEIIRRFLISGFESRQVVIISPIKNLVALKRLTFYPYTHGETPWVTICDLSRFADVVVVTEEATDKDGLRLIYRLAECSMRRYDYSLRLYLSSNNLTLILISDKEAIKNDLVTADEKEYRNIVAEAEKVIASAKLVDYGAYLDLEFRCRIQCK
jgi:hypothetical protein